MEKVYYKVHPLNDKRQPDTRFCYCVTDNEFVELEADRIDAKGFFTISDGKIKKLRKKNDYTLTIRDEHHRDTRNLRRKNPEPDKIDNIGEVVALTQPHRYVHKKGKPVRHKWVYDVLNDRFYVISNELYEELGLNKFSRGHVVYKDGKGKWVKLGKNGAVRVVKTIDEIKAQEVQRDVEANLLFWKGKLKYNRKCMNCIHDCKQVKAVELVMCRMYEKKPKESK